MRFLITLLLIINGFFIFTKDAKAYTCGSLYCSTSGSVSGCVSANGALSGTPSIDSADEGCCTSWCVQQIACDSCEGFTVDQKCNKGASSSNCGVGFCSSDRSECCSTGSNWSKYKVQCNNVTFSYLLGSITCEQQWVLNGIQCSIGDKIKSSVYGLNSSGCECGSTGALYKCCYNSSGDLEAAIGTPSLDDGYGDPEGTCPGGSSIDGVRVKSPVGGVCVPKPSCPAAVTCTTSNACQTVADGACGTKVCPAPAAVTCDSGNCGSSVYSGSCSGSSPAMKTCPACPAVRSYYYCTPTSGTNSCITTDPIYTNDSAGVTLCNSNLDRWAPTHTTSCLSNKSSCDSSCNPPAGVGCNQCATAVCGGYDGTWQCICEGTGTGGFIYASCYGVDRGTPPPSGCVQWSCPVTNGSCSSSGCNSGGYSFTSSSIHYDYWRCLGSP